uniref:Uncharacterized protein n=1 Tax=Polytomella parva TaxID=51329 RepID=A0A7S0YDE1_9CHLO|mmetsp:Transcript_19218/g.34766  ORF Transcript_19218/g.34766 Transcript_19218/m.34766 type:complete len:450 (+) Transcript_19218:69-1418(+)
MILTTGKISCVKMPEAVRNSFVVPANLRVIPGEINNQELQYNHGHLAPLTPVYLTYWTKNPPQRGSVTDLRLSSSQRSTSCYSPQVLTAIDASATKDLYDPPSPPKSPLTNNRTLNSPRSPSSPRFRNPPPGSPSSNRSFRRGDLNASVAAAVSSAATSAHICHTTSVLQTNSSTDPPSPLHSFRSFIISHSLRRVASSSSTSSLNSSNTSPKVRLFVTDPKSTLTNNVNASSTMTSIVDHNNDNNSNSYATFSPASLAKFPVFPPAPPLTSPPRLGGQFTSSRHVMRPATSPSVIPNVSLLSTQQEGQGVVRSFSTGRKKSRSLFNNLSSSITFDDCGSGSGSSDLPPCKLNDLIRSRSVGRVDDNRWTSTERTTAERLDSLLGGRALVSSSSLKRAGQLLQYSQGFSRQLVGSENSATERERRLTLVSSHESAPKLRYRDRVRQLGR